MRWDDRFVALVSAAKHARAALPAVYQAQDRPFAAADPLIVFNEVRKQANRNLAFLEWGSGIGTITIMADLLGYRACGIERDPRLVSAARQLAGDLASRAVFAEGNFIPSSLGRSIDVPDVPLEFSPAPDGPDGYAAIGRALDGFDSIYVFPFPDLIDYFHTLFARAAKPGARLLVYSQTMDVLSAMRTLDGATPLIAT